MSVLIVLVTLSLHTPQPIVYIDLHNVIQNELGSVTKPPQSHGSPTMETTDGQFEVQSTISQYNIYSNKFLRRGLVAAKEKTTTQLYKHESTETPDSLHSVIVRRKIPSTAHLVPVTKETPDSTHHVAVTKETPDSTHHVAVYKKIPLSFHNVSAHRKTLDSAHHVTTDSTRHVPVSPESTDYVAVPHSVLVHKKTPDSTHNVPAPRESRRVLLSKDDNGTAMAISQVKGQHADTPVVNPPLGKSNVGIAKGMTLNERALNALKVSRTAVDVTYAQFHEKKDVLPIVAFFDNRPKYHHNNSTVILVQVRDVKQIRYNRITGCGIDNTTAKTFRVKPLYVYRNWIRPHFPNLTYTEAVVTCYDLPSSHGSKAYVIYRPYRMAALWKVYSERPVVVPKDLSLRHPSIVVCSTVYGQPPWISEWLRYQKTIGVDFIHFYAQESFVEQGGMDIPIVKQFIAENRLVVDVRKAYLNSSQIYYYSQPLLYQDCVLRYHGVYDYAMLVDTDDFFIPRIPDQKDIHYYLDLLFQSVKTGTVRLDWIRYFPSCGLTTPPDKILDGNVTDHLSTYESSYQYVKSIHKLSVTHEVAVHEATRMFPGIKMDSAASNSTAYIAHLRKTNGCNYDRLDNTIINDHQYKENDAY